MMTVLLTSKDGGQKKKKQQVCFNMRDNGTCQFGKECRFSHDVKNFKKAKKKPRGGAFLSSSDDGTLQIVFLCVDGGANVHVICSVPQASI